MVNLYGTLVCNFGDLCIDFSLADVVVYGKRLELSKKEFILLIQLLRAFPEAVNREILAEVTLIPLRKQNGNGVYKGYAMRTVDVHVSRIRNKLKSAGSRIEIANEWGTGYRVYIPETVDKYCTVGNSE